MNSDQKNMEHGAIVALCVVMQTLQKDRLLLYLFNELLLFMMLYNLCADNNTYTEKRKKGVCFTKICRTFWTYGKTWPIGRHMSYFTNLKRILQKTSVNMIFGSKHSNLKSVSVEIGWQQTLESNDKSVSTSFGADLLPCFLETGQNFFFLVETWPARWSVERLPELTAHFETSVKFTAGWPNRMASPLAKATWILKHPNFNDFATSDLQKEGIQTILCQHGMLLCICINCNFLKS